MREKHAIVASLERPAQGTGEPGMIEVKHAVEENKTMDISYQFFRREWGMITNHFIHRDTNGESNSLLDCGTIDFLVVEF